MFFADLTYLKEIKKIKKLVINFGLRMVAGGLVAGVWGNVSARAPKKDLFVITPTGMPYHKLTIGDMAVMNMRGETVEGKRSPSSEYMLHLLIYRSRPDVQAVMHTHSVYASSLAVARKPIPPLTEELVQLVGGGVQVAPYARAGTPELAQAAVGALGPLGAVLLANHGMVGVGRNLEEALHVCLIVEKAAQIYILAMQAGGEAALPPKDVVALRDNYVQVYSRYILRDE